MAFGSCCFMLVYWLIACVSPVWYGLFVVGVAWVIVDSSIQHEMIVSIRSGGTYICTVECCRECMCWCMCAYIYGTPTQFMILDSRIVHTDLCRIAIVPIVSTGKKNAPTAHSKGCDWPDLTYRLFFCSI